MKSFLFSECIGISYIFLSLQRLFTMFGNYHSFITLFTLSILWQLLKHAPKDTYVESYQTLPGMFRSFPLLSEHRTQCKYYLSSLLGLCLSYILCIKYSAWHIVGCQCISARFGATGGGVERTEFLNRTILARRSGGCWLSWHWTLEMSNSNVRNTIQSSQPQCGDFHLWNSF